MKKITFFSLLIGALLLPQLLVAQSTEGKDFWVTLMRADCDNPTQLSLTFSSKQVANVRIDNDDAGYHKTMTLGENDIQTLMIYDADNTGQYPDKNVGYVSDADAEIPVYKALHITSDNDISVIAANYRDKSFDVAAILPTAALRSEYRIQCYPPSSHEQDKGGDKVSQGSHFVIVAAEDDVEVDYTLSVNSTLHSAGQTYTTPKMKKGQAFYVWTGKGYGSNYDFSGTTVKARDNKKIAVFNGNVHTNIPHEIRDRDHIYSQAMPINYWGKHFVVTSSLTTIDYTKKAAKTKGDGESHITDDQKKEEKGTSTEKWERIDKVRIQSVVDSTIIYIDGDSVAMIDFSKDVHHTYEFDFGAKDALTQYTGDGHKYFEGASHYIETSCPCAVHLFFTSNQYDHKEKTIVDTLYKSDSKNYATRETKWSYCNGDPSEIWVNPIEQTMTSMTFGNFETKQVNDHYVNIVTTTSGVGSMVLDGNSISSEFQPVNGNNGYSYARIKIPAQTHTMSGDEGFIAHVYGFGEKESYGYPAGGNTRDLSAAIYINGVKYVSGSTAKLCGDDTIPYRAEVNYVYDSIYWYFGDGTDTMALKLDSINHVYEVGGTYYAYVKIFRDPTAVDDCLQGMIESNDFDSIAFVVNIGKYKVNVVGDMPQCKHMGEPIEYTISMTGSQGVKFGSDSVTLKFNQTAKEDGFDDSMIRIISEDTLKIDVPAKAKNNIPYGIDMHVGSECPTSVLDTTLTFTLKYDIPFVEQRFSNVIGISKDSLRNYLLTTVHDDAWLQVINDPASFESIIYSNFVWTANEDTLFNQQNSVLNLENPVAGAQYIVSFTLNSGTLDPITVQSCPISLDPNKNDQLIYNPGTEMLAIGANCAKMGEYVFVNATGNGSASWYGPDGNVYATAHLPEGGGLIKAPDRPGLFVLKVDAGHQRTFKFLVFE
ncbi:MAG: IgGFc-binding protein [Paludibacteraceae bacterium]|nr:IgGFc-binding protein [Paludibacteraceae bacterium]